MTLTTHNFAGSVNQTRKRHPKCYWCEHFKRGGFKMGVCLISDIKDLDTIKKNDDWCSRYEQKK
jgi:hypothetical protein